MPTIEEIIKQYGQIPELTTFKRPMFIGPHPDDIEFGCGGLISKYKQLNTPVTYVIVTDGGAGSNDVDVSAEKMVEIRKIESIEAANFMNVKDVEFLGLEDGGIFYIEDIISRLAPIVLKYNPDIIFAPDSRLKTECHSDHIKVGEAVRRISQIIAYPIALNRHNIDTSGINHFPNNITLAFYFSDDSNVKVEISENNLSDKIQSIMLHKSQMLDPSSELLINYFKLMAIELGEGFNSGLAEEYQVLVPLTQHVYARGIHYNED